MDRSSRQTIERRVAMGARLLAQPGEPQRQGRPGLYPLHLEPGRDVWLYVPPSYVPERPAPLVLTLHGAGGEGRKHLGHLRPEADANGLILLGPSSLQQTWDMLHGEYGPDVSLIDHALKETFDRYAIDGRHIAIEGFSDGASYALSIGLTNGDLFTHILAFSPGFMAPILTQGKPHIFISHGVDDRVLPIDACSRRIVPQLQAAGYDVRYVEFPDGHTVPEAIAQDAISWFLTQ